jgi:hypothetical protein
VDFHRPKRKNGPIPTAYGANRTRQRAVICKQRSAGIERKAAPVRALRYSTGASTDKMPQRLATGIRKRYWELHLFAANLSERRLFSAPARLENL